MMTVFFDAVFKAFFFLNRPWRGPTTDDRSDEFPDGWLPSNHSTYGVCELKHAISNTPKRKNHTLKDRESEGGHGTSFNKRVVHKHAVLSRPSLHCYGSRQYRGKECRQPRPPPSPRRTYWILPIQKMSGSRGSPCIKILFVFYVTKNKLIFSRHFCLPCLFYIDNLVEMSSSLFFFQKG